MLSSSKRGYLDYLFDSTPATGDQESTKSTIDTNKLRADVSNKAFTKSKANRAKKYPYVYGPKLPQLDPKHLYHLDDVTSEDDDLTLVAHPNQPSLPKSIPKREKRQTKDSTKIKGKLSVLNNKQDNLINRTTVYDQVYDPESETKVTKEITNPITKPVYKLIGKFKHDADLKAGKKTVYNASQPKKLIWNNVPESETEASGDHDTEETGENNVKETGDHGTEETGVDIKETGDKDAEETGDNDIEETGVDASVSEIDPEYEYAKENEEGPVALNSDIHELSLNKTRTIEEIDKDIHENEEGPVHLDSSIHELSLTKSRTAEEIEHDMEENAIGPDANEVDHDHDSGHDDVESKISYNPVFFVDKKSKKIIDKNFNVPIQAIGSKFKNLSAYHKKKQQENDEHLTGLDILKAQQDEDTQKLSVLVDEVIDLQEQCQPLHIKKLDELERLNNWSFYHHKVDLYKHEQEKLQIGKKDFEKKERHRLRDLNRSERTNIRKQRKLQKQQRDLKKIELRGVRRQQRKMKNFENKKKKFITSVPSENHEEADADDEADEIVASSINKVNEPEDDKTESVTDDNEVTLSSEENAYQDAQEDGQELEKEITRTKEYFEPDTQEVYDEKIKEIGKEFIYVSKVPLITHEEQKELSKLKVLLNQKKEEINVLASSLNSIAGEMNTKLSLISQFQPPIDSKVSSPSLEDIKAPTLSTIVPSIKKDFDVPTDNELQLTDPSEISETPEYAPKTSSEESTLSTLEVSSSDIGAETDSESEGETNDHIPVGYKNVLPKRGFLRSVVHDAAAAKVLSRSYVPAAYDQWVIHEGKGLENVPEGFKGILPQRKNLLSVNHDLGNAKHLNEATVPSVYDKWVVNEGDALHEIPVGFKGILPQRKKLLSVNHDLGNAKHLNEASIPSVYEKWAQKADKGNLISDKENLNPDEFSTYTEEDIVSVPTNYKLNDQVL
ncbi:hypothetical protein QEN19_000154 [Hanseniaspora menglaensis]